MADISQSNYLTIAGWMLDLGIRGNDLIIYAIIYGFSQDRKSAFYGDQQYLADWTNSTVRGVRKNLKRLTDGGLLKAEDITGTNRQRYRAIIPDGVHGGTGTKFLMDRNKVPHQQEQSSSPYLLYKKINKTTYIREGSELEKALCDFTEHRKQKKAPLTELAMDRLIKKLEKMAATDEERVKILEQSIENGWTGVFPLHAQNGWMRKKSSDSYMKNDVSADDLAKLLKDNMEDI